MRAALSLAVGVLAAAGAAWLGLAKGPDLMRSALAGWLVLIALPLGALPVLMALDLADRGIEPGADALRGILALLPIAALLGAGALLFELLAPARMDMPSLYGWSTGGTHGLAAAWFTPRWFCIRGLIYLAIWVALALVFMRASGFPSRSRRRLAALGLGLHLVIGTFAALDWTMSLDLGLNSTAFGLLLISLQSAFALTAALLWTLAADRHVPPRALVVLLLAVVAAASFLQFSQYLVVWSANLPREIVWYQHRAAGLGSALFMVAPLVLTFAFVTMMPIGAMRLPVVVSATLLFAFETANLLWLVTPSWRGAFSISVLDGLSLLGLAGVMGACALLIDGRPREARHG